MKITFFKYQGTGNDFVMIDNRENHFPDDIKYVQQLCDRRFGIGADGLILIENHADLDFEMVYFNADGSKSLCGNGSRCAVNFAKQLGIIEKETNFLTIDGPYHATIDGNQNVHLNMRDIEGLETKSEAFFLDNGSPHHIIFTKDNSKTNVYTEGKSIRESEAYKPGGTNVNFVEILDENSIDVRTFERGVEDETLSCGTGVTASSLAASHKGVKSPIKIKTLGGELGVRFTQSENGKFENIWLSGPAEMVFEGQVEI
ncbi:MAG: diaminopimelate epimerase [Cyclobacteriaceae bacterium]